MEERQERRDGKIIERDIEKEMRTAYIDYAMSVIVSRALPDVRDGLKPVHRRILYSMHEDGITADKAYRKCANTVGSVLGRYHPHGDSSVYDAMVRLAQDFTMRYPLIDGHGNFGSVDGDGAAAMRYTEARMAKISEYMLTDIEKNTVDFMPNYDDRLQEPTVLPARIPELLVNGSSGIAVGMATNIPPHNLKEVIDGIIKIIDDDNVTDEDLMQIIKGPDFPTGGTIEGKKNIEEEVKRLKKTVVKPTDEVNDFLISVGTSPLTTGTKLAELLKRTEVTYENMSIIDNERPKLDLQEAEEVEIQVKYEGYLKMQEQQVEKFKKLEEKLLPEDICYEDVKGIRIEARQKLEKLRPRSIGQASRISGVSPADISVLLIYLQTRNNKQS